MQSKEELEEWYKDKDPWGYEVHPDDIKRKESILAILGNNKYERVLDICCGEGWITKNLPGTTIEGIEISDEAAKRFPSNVKRVFEPTGKYDLVVCTGALYEQYDYKKINSWILEAANKHILIAGIKEWLIDTGYGTLLSEISSPYRNLTQTIRLYEIHIIT